VKLLNKLIQRGLLLLLLIVLLNQPLVLIERVPVFHAEPIRFPEVHLRGRESQAFELGLHRVQLGRGDRLHIL
jgi:hypothetical protein